MVNLNPHPHSNPNPCFLCRPNPTRLRAGGQTKWRRRTGS